MDYRLLISVHLQAQKQLHQSPMEVLMVLVFDELDGAFDVTTVVIDGDNFALVTARDDDGLQIADISTPVSKAVASITDGSTDGNKVFDELDGAHGVTTVAIDGGPCLVAARHDNGLQIVDISTPASPKVVASITDGSTDGIKVFDELMVPRPSPQSLLMVIPMP